MLKGHRSLFCFFFDFFLLKVSGKTLCLSNIHFALAYFTVILLLYFAIKLPIWQVLIKTRLDSIPKENTFVFARTIKGSMDHLRGWDSVSSNVKEIEGSLHQPKFITSTKLQKCCNSLTDSGTK